MKRFKKILMLVLVIFGPISLFYFLSKGEYYFKKLPLLHASKAGKPDSYNAFELIDQDGKTITEKDLANKLVIVTYMDAGCPYHCKVDGKMMRLTVYREITEAPGFNDVVIITQVDDSVAAHRKLIEQSLEVGADRWKFVYSKNFSFFDMVLNKKNPYTEDDKKYAGGKVYQRSMLLLDKQLRIRGFMDSSGSIEFKRLMEELRLLKKEYAKNKRVI